MQTHTNNTRGARLDRLARSARNSTATAELYEDLATELKRRITRTTNSALVEALEREVTRYEDLAAEFHADALDIRETLERSAS